MSFTSWLSKNRITRSLMKNRVAQEEDAIAGLAVELPAFGQVRVATKIGN